MKISYLLPHIDRNIIPIESINYREKELNIMTRNKYKNWLDEAEWDLETARILKDQERYNASAFYSQQSVEKLVKAILMFKKESPWGHSTRELLHRLSEIMDEDYSKLIHLSSELDLHYIPSRYPNAHPNSAPHEAYDEMMANDAIDNAEEIFNNLRPIFEIEEEEDSENEKGSKGKKGEDDGKD